MIPPADLMVTHERLGYAFSAWRMGSFKNDVIDVYAQAPTATSGPSTTTM